VNLIVLPKTLGVSIGSGVSALLSALSALSAEVLADWTEEKSLLPILPPVCRRSVFDILVLLI
jgi:hypothetical protein